MMVSDQNQDETPETILRSDDKSGGGGAKYRPGQNAPHSQPEAAGHFRHYPFLQNPINFVNDKQNSETRQTN